MSKFIPIKELTNLLSIFSVKRKYITSMNDAQKELLRSRFTSNLKFYRVSVMPDYNYLVFEIEEVLKNWLYYAGLEYCNSPHMIRYEGSFLAWYHYDDHDRVKEILDWLEKAEELNEDDKDA